MSRTSDKRRPAGQLGAEVPTPEQLNELRSMLACTQEQMALLAYMTPASYHRCERGKATMHAGLWRLMKIQARKLYVQKLELFPGGPCIHEREIRNLEDCKFCERMFGDVGLSNH